METLITDVLIIGSGAAGIRAAIASKESGADTLVVGKAPPGLGTSTILSGAGFAVSFGGVSQDEHRTKTLESGRGINQVDLVETLVSDAPGRISELMSWGMRAHTTPGMVVAEGPPPAFGREVVRCLTGRATKVGVRFANGLTAERLLTDEQHGFGVLAFRPSTSEWLGVVSKAVVIATGGAAALYIRHSNPQRNTGDGYSLASQAGVVLRDMEFIQFYALAGAEPGKPPIIVHPGVADRGRLTNDMGENILEKYNITERPAAARARDRLAQALFLEIYHHGQHVLLDLRSGSTRKRDNSLDHVTAANWNYLDRALGADQRPFRVAPVCHFFMGGISINRDGHTNVPGLFAAGEAAGGLHGANRMGGNALTECMVFGARAGIAAVQWVTKERLSPKEVVFPRIEEKVSTFERERTLKRSKDIKKRLRQVMWEYAGVIRDNTGMTAGLGQLDQLEEELQSVVSDVPAKEIARIIEISHGLKTAKIILQAALRREESRGAHYRSDFPNPHPKWAGSQSVVTSPSGSLKWSFEPH